MRTCRVLDAQPSFLGSGSTAERHGIRAKRLSESNFPRTMRRLQPKEWQAEAKRKRRGAIRAFFAPGGRPAKKTHSSTPPSGFLSGYSMPYSRGAMRGENKVWSYEGGNSRSGTDCRKMWGDAIRAFRLGTRLDGVTCWLWTGRAYFPNKRGGKRRHPLIFCGHPERGWCGQYAYSVCLIK